MYHYMICCKLKLNLLESLKENWVLETNQFMTTCDYLLFTTIIGYFCKYFSHFVMLATTLQLTCN